ncbi:hypothetical protein DVH05_006374 [Phytophthora capsici]|nr:hypothetical protein DVH05_006374 [Phytophthora capsici]
MKEVESLKNNPVLAKGFKSVSENGVMMKRVKSLEKMDPKAVEKLRKAPIEKSVSRVSSYVSRGQSADAIAHAKGAFKLLSHHGWRHWLDCSRGEVIAGPNIS